MTLQRRITFLLPIICLLMPVLLRADTITIDFESLSDGTAVTNQFPGLVFSNTTVLTAGISLNEFEFPPHSGSNVVFDDGGPIEIRFLSPVLSFGGYFTYLAPLTLTAFDALANQVASANSVYSSNLNLSGDPGSSANEFLQVSFADGISLVSIAADPSGASFTLDDAVSSSVPEPATALLLLLSGAMLFAVAGRNSSQPS